MTDDYTPSLNEVRADYVAIHTSNFDSCATGRSLTSEQGVYMSRFDRWLASHDADVAERIAREIEEAGADWLSDAMTLSACYHHAARIARSRATPTFTTEKEIESLASEIHEAYAYQYDECDHGTYAGGAMHGEPYSMCLINAERIIRRRSNPPVASPEIPGFEGTRNALDGLTIRKEKTSD